ncbi:hypothetical protein F2P56_025265 [Juglans regia]|uniref:Syringolide-induced protein 14-1-1 n=2 Tax=Juglans regia TaxID=51240 RepID=A0A833U230_JUGRE|nr:uncharacterized protein At1g76070-like [Juglans regia]KAF5455717.1 hypothetical protein F2P56_025265 [Juglans regia]
MEKQGKPKNKILKFLPRAASAIAVSFQNPPFSPGRDKRSEINTTKLKAHAGRGFSGPIVSIIPVEARRKSRNGGMYETQEPTSPKVSCIGQIKHKKKIKKAAKRAAPPPQDQVKAVSSTSSAHRLDMKKHTSAIRRMFSGKTKPGRNSDVVSPAAEEPAEIPADRAPSLSQMKRFASRRNSLPEFDWTADQITPIDRDHRNYYSDEERDREESDQEEEEVMIPFSAPILMVDGGGVPLQPRKEINLWKRRTMAPPRPLDLNTVDWTN